MYLLMSDKVFSNPPVENLQIQNAVNFGSFPDTKKKEEKNNW